VIGLEQSRAEARRLTRQAHDALSAFREGDAEALHALAKLSSRTRVLTDRDGSPEPVRGAPGGRALLR
jgi:hypothetical protein